MAKWFIAVGVIATQAFASPQLLVVANGDCRDTSLNFELLWLTDALKARSGGDVLEPAIAMAQLSLPPTRSAEEIDRQVESASASFYNAGGVEAIAEMDRAFEDISRLPPGPERWELYKKAEFTRALLLRLGQKSATAALDDSYRRILRVEPAASIDRQGHPKELVDHFEKIRKELSSTAKGRLTVSSAPDGADVFLDGFRVGKTPLNKPLLPGRYQLLLRRGKSSSFVRTVELGLQTPVTVNVDLSFEGMFQASPVPCFSGEDAAPFVTAARLANRLNAQQNIQQVVLLSIQRRGAEPGSLVASLIDVATVSEVRGARLKLTDTAAPPKDIRDLADYLITGNKSQNIVVNQTERAVPNGRLPPGAPSRPLTGAEITAWTGLGVGVLGLGIFTVSMAQSSSSIFPLATDSSGVQAAKDFALVGFGLSAVLTGVATYLLINHSGAPAAAVSTLGIDISPSPQGMAFAVRGALP